MKIKWIILGNVSYVILQWIIISFLSKRFGTVVLGEYFFALSISAPIFLLMSLKLPTLAITHDDISGDKNTLAAVRLVGSVIAILCSVMTAGLLFHNKTNLLMVFSVSLFKFLEQFDDLLVAYFLKKKQYRKVAVVKIQRGVLYLLLVLLSGLIFDNAIKVIFVGTITYSIVWITVNYSEFNIVNVNYKRFIKCFKVGFPIGASAAISSLTTNYSRVYVGVILGTSSLAIYGSIGYTLAAFSIFVSALSQYYVSEFVERKERKRLFLLLLFESQLVSLIFGLILLFFSFFWGESFLRFAYNNEVASYSAGLSIILIATILKASSALLGTSINATQKYSFQLQFSIFSTLLIAVILPFSLQKYQVLGAFYAVLFVNTIEWIIYIIFGFKYYVKYFSKLASRSF